MQTDVLVIGGGPAGLATAIAASLQGLRATVVDPRQPPIDKTCGEGLLPEAVASLHRLGVELDSSVAVPFLGIRFSDEKSSVSARISSAKAFGVRRTTLHRLLVDRAARLGVTLLWGTRVSDLDFRRVSVNGHFIECRWLVGADGQRSNVCKFAGLNSTRQVRSRFGFRRHYSVAPWSDLVEVRWGQRCQMIVTPTSTEEICVSFFTSDPALRIERALEQFPEVARWIEGVRPVSAEAGAVTSLGRALAAVRGNVALVGDASCTVDGIAGQGLSLAFQQALALGEAFAREDLGYYESAHQRITRPPMRMTRLLLAMDASSMLRRKVLRLFAARPALFSKMISIHTGESAPDSLNAPAVLNLGWRVLWA
jgi:flavin-dependent dehydrogenase